MYTPLRERSETMATIAERVGAKSVTFPVGATYVRGYDFVPTTVPSKERDTMFRYLFPIGLEAFVQNESGEMEADIYHHLFDAEHLLVVRSDGSFSFGADSDNRPIVGQPRPIAFRMWKNYATSTGKATYLSGACVMPSWQASGIGAAMTRYVIDMERPEWVFTSTQNPNAKKSMDNALGAVSFPLFNGVAGIVMEEYGLEFARLRGASDHYEPRTMVLKEHYGASLYGKMPVSKDRRYQQLFDRLDRSRGDAYMCIYRCKKV